MHLFLDESGNLGFGKKDTNYFIMASLFTLHPRQIDLLMKRKKIKELPKQYKKIPELKFYNTTDKIRKSVLGGLYNKDIGLSAIIVNKETIHNHLRDVKNIYYGYVTQLLLNKTIIQVNELNLTIDKSLPKKKRNEFNDYIKYKLEKRFKNLTINIEHKNSKESKGLQAVDFVAGACFYKYEHNNSTYYDIIKKKFLENGLIIYDK